MSMALKFKFQIVFVPLLIIIVCAFISKAKGYFILFHRATSLCTWKLHLPHHSEGLEAPGLSLSSRLVLWRPALTFWCCVISPKAGYKLTKLYVILCWNKTALWMVENKVERKFVQKEPEKMMSR